MFSKKVLKQLFEWELFQSKIIANDLLICKTLTEVFFQAEVVIDSIFLSTRRLFNQVIDLRTFTDNANFFQ